MIDEDCFDDCDFTVGGTAPSSEPRVDDSSISESVAPPVRELLHGRLVVDVVEACGLQNLDGIAGLVPLWVARRLPRFVGSCGNLLQSDPFVDVCLVDGDCCTRVAKTDVVHNSIHPNWGRRFSLHICQPVEYVLFKVRDLDAIFFGGVQMSQFLGDAAVSSTELMGGNVVERKLTLKQKLCIDPPPEAAMPSEGEKPRRGKSRLPTLVHARELGTLSVRLQFFPADEAVHSMYAEMVELSVEEAKRAWGWGVGADDSEGAAPTVDISQLSMLRSKPWLCSWVPNAYFSVHHAVAEVKLYHSAHQVAGALPPIPLANGEVYHGGSLWWDIHDAIERATKFICIAGWSVCPTIRLRRTRSRADGAAAGEDGKGAQGQTLGEQLKAKADAGVVVLVMIWGDVGTAVIGTGDAECAAYFAESKVVVAHVPRIAGSVSGKILTHHQKIVCVDGGARPDLTGRSASEAATPGRRRRRDKLRDILGVESGQKLWVEDVTAFVGGIDLTFGRYDDAQKALFRSRDGVHRGDFKSSCLSDAELEEGGPRQPWQDVHAMVTGGAAFDVLRNFVERWQRQCARITLGHIVRRGALSDARKAKRNARVLSQLLRLFDKRGRERIEGRSPLSLGERVSYAALDRCGLLSSPAAEEVAEGGAGGGAENCGADTFKTEGVPSPSKKPSLRLRLSSATQRSIIAGRAWQTPKRRTTSPNAGATAAVAVREVQVQLPERQQRPRRRSRFAVPRAPRRRNTDQSAGSPSPPAGSHPRFGKGGFDWHRRRPSQLRASGLASVGDDKLAAAHARGTWRAQVLRSIDDRSARLQRNATKYPLLHSHKGRHVERSIYDAYVLQIRRARAFLYVENQYFLGSAAHWAKSQDAGANHLVPAEIVARIERAIKERTPFHASHSARVDTRWLELHAFNS